LLARVITWANARPDVHAVLLVGSQARSDHPADEFSDIDVVLSVDDPAVFLDDDEWLAEIAPVICDVVEPTAIGGMSERRVLFASGQDVDFSIVPVEMMRLLGDFKDLHEVRALLGRGARLLVDELEIADEIDAVVPPEPDSGLLSASEYRALSCGFWYQLIVATRKWRRGELWVAISSCEGRLTSATIEMARWWTTLRRPSTDTWHGARFIEEWLDPTVLGALAATRTGYGAAEIRLSLDRLAALFRKLETECREMSGYEPAVDDAEVQRLFRTLTSSGDPPA